MLASYSEAWLALICESARVAGERRMGRGGQTARSEDIPDRAGESKARMNSPDGTKKEDEPGSSRKNPVRGVSWGAKKKSGGPAGAFLRGPRSALRYGHCTAKQAGGPRNSHQLTSCTKLRWREVQK